MSTRALFREDAYLKTCSAQVIALYEDGFETDATVFYPNGGGQPGDIGTITLGGGRSVDIIDTRKGETPETILHKVAPGALVGVQVGDTTTLTLNWERRYAHMRYHTALHLLCAVLKDAAVTGGALDATKARLDFDLPADAMDKAKIEAGLNALIERSCAVGTIWITDEEMQARPELVRTMSVKPPMGLGKVRLLQIGDDVDLQPCGGTHVANTSEIGPVVVAKIENKGKQNRRLILNFA
ncbi:MAG: alanyl-tRNA editing protein [Burkholderiaceae bacterium]